MEKLERYVRTCVVVIFMSYFAFSIVIRSQYFMVVTFISCGGWRGELPQTLERRTTEGFPKNQVSSCTPAA